MQHDRLIVGKSRGSVMPKFVSIFEQDWWLQAAGGGKLRYAEYDDQQSVKAKIAFVERKAQGLKTIGMPLLTRVAQPVITFDTVGVKDQLSRKLKALKGLAEALPDFDIFNITLPPESDLDLAYCLSGYLVKANYTFRTSLQSSDVLLSNMDQKVRYNIKTGSNRMSVQSHEDIERYISLSKSFIRDRAFKDMVDYDLIVRLWDACFSRNQSSIISCVDNSGHEIASAILVWDEHHLYYWLNCRNPELRDYTANSVLIWHAIKFSNARGLVFDIDGFSTPNAGVFLSRFGLQPCRRFDISMTGSAAKLRIGLSEHLAHTLGPKFRRQLLSIRNRIRGLKPGAV